MESIFLSLMWKARGRVCWERRHRSPPSTTPHALFALSIPPRTSSRTCRVQLGYDGTRRTEIIWSHDNTLESNLLHKLPARGPRNRFRRYPSCCPSGYDSIRDCVGAMLPKFEHLTGSGGACVRGSVGPSGPPSKSQGGVDGGLPSEPPQTFGLLCSFLQAFLRAQYGG